MARAWNRVHSLQEFSIRSSAVRLSPDEQTSRFGRHSILGVVSQGESEKIVLWFSFSSAHLDLVSAASHLDFAEIAPYFPKVETSNPRFFGIRLRRILSGCTFTSPSVVANVLQENLWHRVGLSVI
jgi:hypothetical protein